MLAQKGPPKGSRHCRSSLLCWLFSPEMGDYPFTVLAARGVGADPDTQRGLDTDPGMHRKLHHWDEADHHSDLIGVTEAENWAPLSMKKDPLTLPHHLQS